MSLTITVNGQNREFPGLAAPASLAEVIAEMNLKGDRIAVEHNGVIAQRTRWAEVSVASGDRLEVVHFVGGGHRRWMGEKTSREASPGRLPGITALA
jgi:sulfur carrier protein